MLTELFDSIGLTVRNIVGYYPTSINNFQEGCAMDRLSRGVALKMTWLVATLAVTACGGGADAGADFVSAYGLRAQAEVWVNWMPRVETPGEPFACPSVVAVFAIRAGSPGFPSGVKAERVVLAVDGKAFWSADVEVAETGLDTRLTSPDNWLGNIGRVDGKAPPGTREEPILRGVARGCESPNLPIGRTVDVSIMWAAGEQRAAVETKSTFYAAY